MKQPIEFRTALVILFSVLILTAGFLIYQSQNISENPASVPAVNQVESSSSTTIGATVVNSTTSVVSSSLGQESYISKALGLSFEYVQDGTVVINESGTILTIGTVGYPYPDDLIEVFRKNTQISFQQAVENLLSSENLNCTMYMVSSSTNFIPTAFDQEGSISYTGTGTWGNGAYSGQCSYGKAIYDDNSAAYFGYSSNYPDRFYFYDFGQSVSPDATLNPDPYPADNATNDWRDTIQLINF